MAFEEEWSSAATGCRLGDIRTGGNWWFLARGSRFLHRHCAWDGQYLVVRFLKAEGQPIFHLHDFRFLIKTFNLHLPVIETFTLLQPDSLVLDLVENRKIPLPVELEKPP